ncbi:hypothetical protein ACA910_010562 [Epithemia clementina (nom. ined.)]
MVNAIHQEAGSPTTRTNTTAPRRDHRWLSSGIRPTPLTSKDRSVLSRLEQCYEDLKAVYGPDQCLDQEEFLAFLCLHSNGDMCVNHWWELDTTVAMAFFSALTGEDAIKVNLRQTDPDVLPQELLLLCTSVDDYLNNNVLSPIMTPTRVVDTAEPTAAPSGSPILTITMSFTEACLGLAATEIPGVFAITEILGAVQAMTESYYNDFHNSSTDCDNRKRNRRALLSSKSDLQDQQHQGIIVRQVSTNIVYHDSRHTDDGQVVEVFYNQTMTFTSPKEFTAQALEEVVREPFDTQEKRDALRAQSSFSDFPQILWVFSSRPTPGQEEERVGNNDEKAPEVDEELGHDRHNEVYEEVGFIGFGILLIVLCMTCVLAFALLHRKRKDQQAANLASSFHGTRQQSRSSKRKQGGDIFVDASRSAISCTMTATQCSAEQDFGALMMRGRSEAGLVTVEEERLVQFTIPAGKLGIVIRTTSEGAPVVVRSVKKHSPIQHLIAAGDKIAKIDGKNVSQMTITQIRAILRQTKHKSKRKVTVLRVVQRRSLIANEEHQTGDTTVWEEELSVIGQKHEPDHQISHRSLKHSNEDQGPLWVQVKDPLLSKTSLSNWESGRTLQHHPDFPVS